MADEQYEWLDKEVAERLLRGEPVDPVGGHACTEAESLVAALDAAARAARPATGELPGEAAALAAFRTARRSARDSARARKAAGAQAGGAENATRQTGTEVLPTVRIRAASGGSGPRTSAASVGAGRNRLSRWSRPVRFGLVASFAGCALGGVAVAAGTGMLPGPFGGRAPVPATSVSAAATPEELGSRPAGAETPRAPSSAPERGVTEPTPDRSASSSGRSADAGSNRTEKRGAREPGGSASGPTKTPGRGGLPDRSGGGSSGEWYAKALKACRDYRNGHLDDDRRRKLEILAKGARNLDRFCDRVIEGSDKGGNGAPGSDGGGSGGNGGHGGHGGNGGKGDGGQGGDDGRGDGDGDSDGDGEGEGEGDGDGSNGENGSAGGGSGGGSDGGSGGSPTPPPTPSPSMALFSSRAPASS
ncbi:hypothetical protein [Streptomyces sp. NPDC014685]|uniref:hypothetical protein n=1 Tax=Streptomyces sp. NPDC014685 TaxID=3364881 RepID=UPI0036FAB205